MTLEELSQKCQNGELNGVMMIDNDDMTFVEPDEDWVNVPRLFQIDPHDFIRQALDLLGIPHESV